MIQPEKTADGSYTLFVPELNEHYHSVKGARTESEHIFIRMGLEHSLSSSPRVLEIGFGTGLNAFLTLLSAETSGRKVHYTAIERFPVDERLLRQLAYPEQICPERTQDYYSLHAAPWDTDVQITPHFTLHKVKGDFTAFPLRGTYDVVYFDAFAPEKQPEMWSGELFGRLYEALAEGGILTTYCAKGSVRRMMQASGFEVERLPGPPGGKREILRGNKA